MVNAYIFIFYIPRTHKKVTMYLKSSANATRTTRREKAPMSYVETSKEFQS